MVKEFGVGGLGLGVLGGVNFRIRYTQELQTLSLTRHTLTPNNLLFQDIYKEIILGIPKIFLK